MTFVPSPQQQAALDFVRSGIGNAILVAVAGAGKTTTLVEICKLISNAVFAAYNKKIADEIGGKLRAAGIDWKQARAATFHSLGLGYLKKWTGPDIKVNENKVADIMERIGTPKQIRGFVGSLVSHAKQAAIGVRDKNELGDDEFWLRLVDHFGLEEKLDAEGAALLASVKNGIEVAIEVLHFSLDLDSEEVDFDDMIYAPLIHDIRFSWQYDWVLIDEAQDTNAARRLLAERMLRPGGRLIAVGDPHQAIYGFAGADNNALDLISDAFDCAHLPLTVTYRCPKKVVAHAHQWVSHIQAHESAPEGEVRYIGLEEFQKLAPEPGDAILCRNTKPLVEMAFDLIRRRIPCHVEGRDIGKGLLALATKWERIKTIGALSNKLHEYEAKETERLIEKGRDAQLGALQDKIATLRVLMGTLPLDSRIDGLRAIIESIFQDTDGNARPTVTLSTVHKSKGREWDRVYLLGRNRLMPSPFATQEWAKAQERNLCYVAVTRAKSELVEVHI